LKIIVTTSAHEIVANVTHFIGPFSFMTINTFRNCWNFLSY